MKCRKQLLIFALLWVAGCDTFKVESNYITGRIIANSAKHPKVGMVRVGGDSGKGLMESDKRRIEQGVVFGFTEVFRPGNDGLYTADLATTQTDPIYYSLYAWDDENNDGIFDATESASIATASVSNQKYYRLIRLNKTLYRVIEENGDKMVFSTINDTTFDFTF